MENTSWPEVAFGLGGLGALIYVTSTLSKPTRLSAEVQATRRLKRRRSSPVNAEEEDVTRRRSADNPVQVMSGRSSQPAGFEFDDDLERWPNHVQNRVHTTFLYLGGTAVLTGLSTVVACRSPKLQSMCYGWEPVAFFGGMTVLFLSTSVVVLTPYEPGRFGLKQLAWLLNSALTGIALTPLCRFMGSSLVRSAILTTGTIGALSAVGIMARSENFLMMAGPMALTLGAAIAASTGLSIYPLGTEVGNMLNDMNMNAMFVLFSLTLLYDIHNMIREAETIPPDFKRDALGIAPFDPIRHAVSLFNSVLGIFIRVLYYVVKDEAEKKRKKTLEEEARRASREERERRDRWNIFGRSNRRRSAGEYDGFSDVEKFHDPEQYRNVGRNIAGYSTSRRQNGGNHEHRRKSRRGHYGHNHCDCFATAMLRWRMMSYFSPTFMLRGFI